jgi:hypothetical protein
MLYNRTYLRFTPRKFLKEQSNVFLLLMSVCAYVLIIAMR